MQSFIKRDTEEWIRQTFLGPSSAALDYRQIVRVLVILDMMQGVVWIKTSAPSMEGGLVQYPSSSRQGGKVQLGINPRPPPKCKQMLGQPKTLGKR